MFTNSILEIILIILVLITYITLVAFFGIKIYNKSKTIAILYVIIVLLTTLFLLNLHVNPRYFYKGVNEMFKLILVLHS